MTARTARDAQTPARPIGGLRLTWLHTRMQFVEAIRVPIVIIGNMLFPALALLFFVVPQSAIASDPAAAAAAVSQLAAFAVMSTCLFTYGLGVADDRALPFDPFVRTLPAGAGPRMAGRVLTGLLFIVLGLLPLVAVGAVFTEAKLSWAQAGQAALLVPPVALPFLMLGLGIGYTMSAKAAVAVVQVTVFPLAFAGGMFVPPDIFPAWLDSLSTALPSRAARDLVIQASTGLAAPPSAWPVLLGWTALFTALAVWAYRRDEGRRFR